jgi:hypothetical protein
MAETKNSMSSLLAQFLRLQKNSLEMMSKVSEATTSSRDTIDVNMVDENGQEKVIQIPSFGFIKSELNRLEENQKQLAGLGDNTATLRMPDGSHKKIFESSILRDPAQIGSLQVPGEFKIKNNWFFESFLNPLLFVTFDVTGMVSRDMEKAVVKRVIVNAQSDEDKEFFDNNIKGRNDIEYKELFSMLNSAGIGFFIDEENVELPLGVMRYRGTFDVIRVFDEETTQIIDNKQITIKKRKYKLNKISYTDTFAGVDDSRSLNINDILITVGGSRYKVESVDLSDNTVIIKRISGHESITMGVDVLSILADPYSSKEIQVNVGFDERQVIFLKPIDPDFNVAGSLWSPGTGFWTNELNIKTPDGNTSFENFYKSQVVDFGLQFINSAKERSIPSVYGETPEAPSLDDNNFKVTRINDHKKDTKEIDSVKKQLQNKAQLENNITQLEEAINNKKNEINNAAQRTPAEKRKLKSDLESLAKEKSSKVNLYSSVVKELATKAKDNPLLGTSAKFRVRGFWPMPLPKVSDKTLPQEVIQFIVSYRYLRKDGNSVGTQSLEYADSDGTTKRGNFTNWNEYKTELRRRRFDENTGFYVWDIEDTEDPEVNNINQLDISISSGEKVELRIKSISEAGWPLNPLVSDWSDTIVIDFPEELELEDQTGMLLSEAAAEENRVKFQEDLNARGLDIHLLNSFTSGDKYYSHSAEDVASGFFTDNGLVINMFEKLKSIDTELQRLKQLIEKAKGTLSVYLIDDTGNVMKINPNSTTKIFAGFYKDLIKTGSGTSTTFDHGKVISKSYTLRIENSAATALELASYLPGGIGELAASTLADNTDFNNNRIYGRIPLSLSGINNVKTTSLSQDAPFQSAQVKSQWLYLRRKNVGLDANLYDTNSPYTPSGTPTNSYTTHINGWHVLPILPAAGTQHIDIWSGTPAGSGNGWLSEFCIHKEHPNANGLWNNGEWNKTGIDNNLTQNYLKFVHAEHFYRDVTDSEGRLQLGYAPFEPVTSAMTSPNYKNYPAKLGFHKNDEFLVGRYTCGAYLFMSPVDYSGISVDGNNELAKKTLEFGEDRGINIPIIFQFRCSDKIGKIGGHRASGDISNISYTKTIGLDIQVRGESTFSFDVEVSCKYEQDSLASPVFIPNSTLDRLDVMRKRLGSK